ncbi:hypothetical protein Patl1_29072 [Pistacia atlantica]|uniref:Uncharacterized protein n=1 Tax=Pistacia atlantica TaxID=434234 RepID=A0ACC1BFS2_9ROSI|nr:hypothetical protein Patl1_29072 [Pistacia atlantica]
MNLSQTNLSLPYILSLILLTISLADKSFCIRFPDRITNTVQDPPDHPLNTAVFALGCFWRSEAVFGCLNGVVRTTVGYAGGSKTNPDYRSLGDHAESVQVEYDPRLITFRELLEVFWSSHDCRQVFGQGPDVGNQYRWKCLQPAAVCSLHFLFLVINSYFLLHAKILDYLKLLLVNRSIIFTNGTDEFRLAALSKEKEQMKSKSSIVATQIQKLGTFYSAEPEHQKFELKRNPFLLQLMGNLPEDELEKSSLAAKLNSYAAELCPPNVQKLIDVKINDIIRKGWPILRDV